MEFGVDEITGTDTWLGSGGPICGILATYVGHLYLSLEADERVLSSMTPCVSIGRMWEAEFCWSLDIQG